MPGLMMVIDREPGLSGTNGITAVSGTVFDGLSMMLPNKWFTEPSFSLAVTPRFASSGCQERMSGQSRRLLRKRTRITLREAQRQGTTQD